MVSFDLLLNLFELLNWLGRALALLQRARVYLGQQTVAEADQTAYINFDLP